VKTSLALLAALGLAGAAFAAPPPRTPEQRQTLVDLAFVLGQAHALHRVCAGKDDDTWRGRMQQVIAAEAPDAAFTSRLSNSFNAGFLSPDARAKDCAAAEIAERRVAARGAAQSRKLASPTP
jgi:uncharacterized protein (TIGR02301 family)